MIDQRGANAAVSRNEMQRRRRYAGLMQQPDGVGGNQWRLLGGLGHDSVAGHQRGGDLAKEDR